MWRDEVMFVRYVYVNHCTFLQVFVYRERGRATRRPPYPASVGRMRLYMNGPDGNSFRPPPFALCAYFDPGTDRGLMIRARLLAVVPLALLLRHRHQGSRTQELLLRAMVQVASQMDKPF